MKHELYLDLQIAQSQVFRERGSIRYALEHARALTRKKVVRGVGLNPLAPFPHSLDLELRAFPGLQWSTAGNFRQAASKGPLAFYMMSPFAASHSEYLLPPWVLRPHIPLIVTLVDLTPLSSDDPLLTEPRIARRYRSRFRIVEQADLILTISENTAKDALRLLEVEPSRVFNIGTGVSEFFSPAPAVETSPGGGRVRPADIKGPYVLSLTGTWEWKNTERLIEAYAGLPRELRAGLQLVIVCRLTDDYRRKWTEHAKRCGLRPGEMVLTDLISDLALRSLYRGAELFVYPSLYEGFGLPAAEAAACGCPIIVSNTSSMPEIADFPPGTFNPTDAEDMSALMQRALTDEPFREQLRRASARAASRNTWDSVADKTIQSLAMLDPGSAQTGEPASGELRRVAMAGTFDPANGDAGSLSIAMEMARLCALDLFVDAATDVEDLRSTTTGLRAFPLAALGRHLNPAAYDVIIYKVDPDAAPAELHEYALRYPGIVWIVGGTPAGRLPSFGHGRSTASTLISGARGLVAGSPGERSLLELDQGPLARLPASIEISSSESAPSAARRMIDFAGELQVAAT